MGFTHLAAAIDEIDGRSRCSCESRLESALSQRIDSGGHSLAMDAGNRPPSPARGCAAAFDRDNSLARECMGSGLVILGEFP